MPLYPYPVPKQSGYDPVPFGPFSGGLNLRDSPGEVSGSEAIDLLNVLFSERGAVTQRAGYAQLTSAELTNQPDSLFPFITSAGTKRLLVGNGNRVDALDTAGASQANVASTASPHFFVRFGGPTQEAVYFANGTDQAKRLLADVFTSPAGLAGQTGRFVAVTPTSNRLVVARESGSTAGNNPSSVNFSDPGAPETFTSTNYVDLDPGDGEAITGMVVWGDQLFVFKESKYWVLSGEGSDTTGGAVFPFTKVDMGAGLVASRALAAGLDGVYFMGRDGVYRTRGTQGAEKLSDKIDPFFLGGTSIYYKSNTLNHGAVTTAAAAFHDDKLFLAVPTGTSATNDRVLVYDPAHQWWSLYDLPAAALARFRVGDQAELVFAAATGSNYVYRHSSAYTADAMSASATGGSAITARWRSGWVDMGSTVPKTIRESHVTGTGSLSLLVTKDWEDSTSTPQAVSLSASSDTWGDGTGADTWGDGTSTDLWGPANTIKTKAVRYAVRGEVFSTSLSNSTINTTFAVHRLAHHLREHRTSSVVGTERV